MSESKHTQGKWEYKIDVDSRHYKDYVLTSPNRPCILIARIYGPDAEANAEFIVRACNSHDALLTASRRDRGL